MDTFRRLVLTAVMVGLVTGALVTLVQHFGTTSIIARAEVYEGSTAERELVAPASPTAAGTAAHAGHGAAAHAHFTTGTQQAAPAWEPEDGVERTLYTLLANMLTAIAFSLLLTAAIELRGGAADWRTGLFWGLAGFVTFTLAPGLGLPPELPGNAAAPVSTRQLWWALTAAATAGGLASMFLQRRPLWAAVGVALLIAPHLYGAPQPDEYSRAAPERLEHDFIVVATMTNLVFWIVLGTLTGHLLEMWRRAPERRPQTLGVSLR